MSEIEKSPEKKDARVIDTRPSTAEPVGKPPVPITTDNGTQPSAAPQDSQNPQDTTTQTPSQRRLGQMGIGAMRDDAADDKKPGDS